MDFDLAVSIQSDDRGIDGSEHFVLITPDEVIAKIMQQIGQWDFEHPTDTLVFTLRKVENDAETLGIGVGEDTLAEEVIG